jgi:hypothetical protein
MMQLPLALIRETGTFVPFVISPLTLHFFVLFFVIFVVQSLTLTLHLNV